MSIKKGYIVKSLGKWVLSQCSGDNGVACKPVPIHPDSLPTILFNGSLKPEYQGEVEYEVTKVDIAKLIDHEHILGLENEIKTYAIPVESKGDVWEEAWDKYRASGGTLKARYFLKYLKQHYNITKKHP